MNLLTDTKTVPKTNGSIAFPAWQDPALTQLELPSLTAVGGAFQIEGQVRLSYISAPVLSRVKRLLLGGNRRLPHICNIGLKASGIMDKKKGVDFSGHCFGVPRLVRGDADVMRLGGVQNPAHCLGLDVDIRTEQDYQKYMQDAKFKAATELGHVVISWKNLKASQLESLLVGKTALHGGLIFEYVGGYTKDGGLGLDRIRLPDLRVINGSLDIIQCNNVQSVQLPALEAIENQFIINLAWYNADSRKNKLAKIDLPRLTRIGHTLNFFGAEVLQAFNVPVLQTVGESFIFTIGGCHNVRIDCVKCTCLYANACTDQMLDVDFAFVCRYAWFHMARMRFWRPWNAFVHAYNLVSIALD